MNKRAKKAFEGPVFSRKPKLEKIPGGVAVGDASPLAENFKPSGESTKTFASSFDLDSPLVTDEQMEVISKFYLEHDYKFNPDEPWIQTFTGRRFTPTNPNPNAIVIQDIAHSLSMQCRFTGHISKFYSVAQHCVLVSYICDSADAFWGLLHDATEAYLVDLPAPLKRSGKFDNFKEVEKKLSTAICTRFKLPFEEPPSVKRADVQLLVTEARDLMPNKRSDWECKANPLPFKIIAWSPDEAEDKYMHRFAELTKYDNFYEHYLHYKYGNSNEQRKNY